MNLSFSKPKKTKPARRPHSHESLDAVETVRGHLDSVELGSPLLFPY